MLSAKTDFVVDFKVSWLGIRNIAAARISKTFNTASFIKFR